MKTVFKFIKIISFLVLLGGALYLIVTIVKPNRSARPWDVSAKVHGFYELEKNSLDVVFLGASHSFCTFDPYIFQKEAGIKSYAFGTNQQPLSVSYYYLKEVLKHQKPKVIVLELLYISEREEFISPKMIHFAADDMPWSKNKHDLLKTNLKNPDILEFSALYNYHDRWKSLKFSDFDTSHKSKFFGFTPLYGRKSKPLEFGNYEAKPLPEKSQKYLEKIIKFTKANDIELVLTYVPHSSANKMFQSHLKTAMGIAAKNQIDFINYMDQDLLEQIDIDITTDFDKLHTNVYGAHKISKHLASYLETKYSFDKSRDFNEYKLVNEYYEMADSLPKIKKFDDYLAYLSDKDVYI